MSQCQGVNIYASGDYLLDERQGYLCTTIERLRTHMTKLKERLEEEKILLSELKAETEYLTMQQTENIRVPEEHHPISRQSVRQNSVRPVSATSKLTYAGDVAKAKRPVVEEPKKNFNRIEYMKRLREIDSLCKEEMTRMNTVVEQMEPLKQLASDWMLETTLNEVSGVSTSDVTPVLELGTVQPYRPLSGIEPAYNADLSVIPTNRPISPALFFMPEGKCDAQPGPLPNMKAPLNKSTKSKLELKSAKKQELKLDCLLKPTSENNTASTTDMKGLLQKRKNETNMESSSSDVSLSSLEALKEQNITLIEVPDDNCKEGNKKQLEKKDEEDWKSTGSGKTSKSAISLESIQRAFADHHKKKRKAVKSENSDKNALSLLRTAHEEREKISLVQTKGEEEQRKQDKLFSYLHPSAKKIVKNWVMVGREENICSSEKPERTKKCTLNLSRNKDAEVSLCEDDVINKFLYQEEGYVYTPLFVSETEEECSSVTSSLSESE